MVRTIAAVFVFLCIAGPAAADAPSKVFVASTGNDANDGGRTTPKRSFQAAHDSVASGGDIVVLDTAGYGKLSITKGVSIIVPPGVSGFITSSAPLEVGISINAPNASVALRGLIVEAGAMGVFAESVGQLVIEDCTFRDTRVGIYLLANATASLVVSRGSVRNAQEGIHVAAAAQGAAVSAVIAGVDITGSWNYGIDADVRAAGGTVKVVARRSAITGSGFSGILVQGGGEVVMDGLIIANNRKPYESLYGVGNLPAGVLYSRGNNTIYANPESGSATPIMLAGQLVASVCEGASGKAGIRWE